MKTRNEIAQLLKDALAGQDTDAIWFAIGELEKNDAGKPKSDRIDGIEYALNELREVYGEGIEDTDIWAEYMSKESNYRQVVEGSNLVCEEYNGWTNRETWATALHIDNDQGIQNSVQELATSAHNENDDTDTALAELAESIEEHITELVESDWDGVKLMRRDIGSLWRVNWREVAKAYVWTPTEGVSA